MGGRGTASGMTPDKDQVADYLETAKDLGYSRVRYTGSDGVIRTVAVKGNGRQGGTMIASYNARTDQMLRVAASWGTDRLQSDLKDLISRYQLQEMKADVLHSKAASTRAKKLDAEIKAAEQALRIAKRRKYPQNGSFYDDEPF